MGILPLFHSFGFTGTIWLPLVNGFSVIYHPNPLDAATIGEMVQKYRATMLISTPSFCLGYTRKCTAEQFATLRYAVVGAEKLREPVARAFKEKYGLDLLEAYGCTEMAPGVAVNAPTILSQEEKDRSPAPSAVRCRAWKPRSSTWTRDSPSHPAPRGCSSFGERISWWAI